MEFDGWRESTSAKSLAAAAAVKRAKLHQNIMATFIILICVCFAFSCNSSS